RGSPRAASYRTTEHLNTPLHNPIYSPDDTVREIEVTDPTHPLFGRRFPLLSSYPQRPMAGHVFIAYRTFRLRLPRTGTNLEPQPPRVPTKLTLQAITELISLAQQCEVLCPTIPVSSGTNSAPNSK